MLPANSQRLQSPVTASHPNIRVDAINRAMRLNADDFVPFGTKLNASRSEAFMRDDGPTEQIQEAG